MKIPKSPSPGVPCCPDYSTTGADSQRLAGRFTVGLRQLGLGLRVLGFGVALSDLEYIPKEGITMETIGRA